MGHQTDTLIKCVIRRTDIDSDGFLTPEELKLRIHNNMKEHLEKSKKDADEFFSMVDLDKDGTVRRFLQTKTRKMFQIVWEEFEPHFSKMHGSHERDDNQVLDLPTEGIRDEVHSHNS